MLIGLNIITYVQIDGSWTLEFKINTFYIIFSFVLFIVGRKMYMHEKSKERLTSFQEKKKKYFYQVSFQYG